MFPKDSQQSITLKISFLAVRRKTVKNYDIIVKKMLKKMMSRLLLEVTAVSIILTFYVFLCNLILFAGVASICKCCAKYKFSKRRYNPFNFEKLRKQLNLEYRILPKISKFSRVDVFA